ncbi:MAG: hypothetical protein R2867_09475 [Caldilineaceae bacterium]
MAVEQKNSKINWYRSPLPRTTLNELNQRSDLRGLAQTLGHLGLLMLTGTMAWIAATSGQVSLLLFLLLLHGTVYAFLLNGFHELCHGTVFRTKWLNTFFLYLFSFLGGTTPSFSGESSGTPQVYPTSAG